MLNVTQQKIENLKVSRSEESQFIRSCRVDLAIVSGWDYWVIRLLSRAFFLPLPRGWIISDFKAPRKLTNALLRLRIKHAMESYQGALPVGEVRLQSATAELSANIFAAVLTE